MTVGKLPAIDAFELNMSDALLLVGLAKAMTNTRKRRMRKELRERIAVALDVRRRDMDALDCIESPDFFVVLKPQAAISREQLQDVRPLLRQALVAACAAMETYVADRTMELLKGQWRSGDKPDHLVRIPMTVGDWFEIDRRYKRGAWGVRAVVEKHVRQEASPAPSKVGEIFAIAGQKKLLSRVDQQRKLRVGTSTDCLEVIYARRNQIAHTGDRSGRGRAPITVEEIDRDLRSLRDIVEAIEKVTAT